MQEIAFASPKSLRFVGLQQKSLSCWFCGCRSVVQNARKFARTVSYQGLPKGYPQVFNRFCGRGKSEAWVRMPYFARDFKCARSLSRKTNLSPDHTSSTAQILTSTNPAASPIVLTVFSERSVVTPELFFGMTPKSFLWR
jgi:hypothetical protein